MEILAVIETPSDLRAACKARRAELRLTHLDVDEIAGLHTGYYGRLELGKKGFGEMSLAAVLGALGLELVVVPKGTHAAS